MKVFMNKDSDVHLTLVVDGVKIWDEVSITPNEALEVVAWGGPFTDDGNELLMEEE